MKSIDLHIPSQRWDVLDTGLLHWNCVYVVGNQRSWLPIKEVAVSL